MPQKNCVKCTLKVLHRRSLRTWERVEPRESAARPLRRSKKNYAPGQRSTELHAPPSARGYLRVRTGFTTAIAPTSRLGSALGFGRNICERLFATSVT